jgi:hypothetical protein
MRASSSRLPKARSVPIQSEPIELQILVLKRFSSREPVATSPENAKGDPAASVPDAGSQNRFPAFCSRFILALMDSPARQISLVSPVDGRQSETALAIARGTARLLRSLGFASVSELPLPSGRRADLVALNQRGEIWIVEIKSSVEDLRADQKWHEYRAHCDRLFFAFTQDLPCEIFPEQTGLIVADAYGAHMHCDAPEHRLPAPTRKLMTVWFAIAAAQRINRLIDPQGHAEF